MSGWIPDRDEDGNIIMHIGGVPSENNKRIRFVGTHNFTVPGGQSRQQDWAIPQLTHKGQNVPSIFLGVSYCASGGSMGDTVTFQVVDVDGLVSPAGTVLDEFGKDYYIFPGTPTTIREFKANLLTGLYIRVIYNNAGASEAEMAMNILRLIDTSGV